MNEEDLRRTVESVVSALNELGLPFHLTGGLASSYYGEPRMTRDADFVIGLTPAQGRRLTTALDREFLIQPEPVRTAIQNKGVFQALHREALVKADFHVGERVPGELQRSVVREIFDGLRVPMVSKEDAILSKLIWAREGSQKSRSDIAGMLMDPTTLDMNFVRQEARRLDCEDVLDQIEREIESPGRGG